MTIEELIKEVLFIEEGIELTNETGPEDIDSWDSLGHVNIITAVEDEFDIEISPEEIGEIKTIGDIKKMLAQKDINPE
ncbi:MAG TPA: acyl carrier protein [Balneolaceae bacterium]|nr:acyl carrier protein [Balneola sp.]HBQ61478.1 acyl carrier protein [Balneolaceae bacterium]|tara:strand:- start:146295 stop:146528 length:234 start_codon:yes stop_codon:yes gene_type:complete